MQAVGEAGTPSWSRAGPKTRSQRDHAHETQPKHGTETLPQATKPQSCKVLSACALGAPRAQNAADRPVKSVGDDGCVKSELLRTRLMPPYSGPKPCRGHADLVTPCM